MNSISLNCKQLRHVCNDTLKGMYRASFCELRTLFVWWNGRFCTYLKAYEKFWCCWKFPSSAFVNEVLFRIQIRSGHTIHRWKAQTMSFQMQSVCKQRDCIWIAHKLVRSGDRRSDRSYTGPNSQQLRHRVKMPCLKQPHKHVSYNTDRPSYLGARRNHPCLISALWFKHNLIILRVLCRLSAFRTALSISADQ